MYRLDSLSLSLSLSLARETLVGSVKDCVCVFVLDTVLVVVLVVVVTVVVMYNDVAFVDVGFGVVVVVDGRSSEGHGLWDIRKVCAIFLSLQINRTDTLVSCWTPSKQDHSLERRLNSITGGDPSLCLFRMQLPVVPLPLYMKTHSTWSWKESIRGRQQRK